MDYYTYLLKVEKLFVLIFLQYLLNDARGIKRIIFFKTYKSTKKYFCLYIQYAMWFISCSFSHGIIFSYGSMQFSVNIIFATLMISQKTLFYLGKNKIYSQLMVLSMCREP